jgi:predicted DNA-binding transcriptional regulator AlpA
MSNSIQAIQILRAKQVTAVLKISKSMFYQMIREGSFPHGIRFGKRAVGWSVDVINAWVASRQSNAPTAS